MIKKYILEQQFSDPSNADFHERSWTGLSAISEAKPRKSSDEGRILKIFGF